MRASKVKFFESFNAATIAVEGTPWRLYDDKVYMVMAGEGGKLLPDQVYCYRIMAREQQCGHGSAALGFLASLADDCGIEMLLHASPYDPHRPGPDALKLKEIYGRFGFIPTGRADNEMLRPVLLPR